MMWHYVWWCDACLSLPSGTGRPPIYDYGTMYDDVTLCMMMWRMSVPAIRYRASSYIWWCENMYDDVTLCMMMWQYVWWCDNMYDDVTLCLMMWHYLWWCDTMYDDVTHVCPCHQLQGVLLYMIMGLCMMIMYDDVTIYMMMWHMSEPLRCLFYTLFHIRYNS